MNTRKARTILTHPLRGYATATFAITNRCNATCGFCSIWRQEPAKAIDPRDMELALRKLHRLGIRYIQFTGGEPFLYQHLVDTIRFASDLGILSTIVTNGSLITEERALQLRDADVGEVQISIDHCESAIIEQNRGIPKLGERIENGLRYLKAYGVPISVSTTISRLLQVENGDYRRLLAHCQKLGFRAVYFCYPMTGTKSTYTLGGDGNLVSYTPDELIGILTHLRELKREGCAVDNSMETIDVDLDHLRGKSSKYPC